MESYHNKIREAIKKNLPNFGHCPNFLNFPPLFHLVSNIINSISIKGMSSKKIYKRMTMDF